MTVESEDGSTIARCHWCGAETSIDMDDDGKPEIIALSGGTIKIFRNTSSRGIINASSFASPLTLSTGVNARLHDIIDLDGDGKLDIVWPNQDDNNFSVYRNTGSVGNISFTSRINFPCGINPISSKCGDVDGDGKPDLILTYITGNSVGVFKNTSTTGTINFSPGVDFATGTNPYSANIADMNGDGKPEIIVANYSGNSVSIFKNQITSLEAPVIATSGNLSCPGQTITLGTSLPYNSYLWSTGETTATINVGAGNYSVSVTNSSGCTKSSDISVVLSNVDKPVLTCGGPVLVNNTPVLCTGAVTLTPPTVIDNCSSFGNALSFDGGYVAAPNNSSLNPLNEWTIETWVRRTRSGVQESLIEKYNQPGSTYGYLLRVVSSDKAMAGFVFGSFAGTIFAGDLNS